MGLLKLLGFIFEAGLSIPIFSGTMIIILTYVPLIVMFVFHIVNFVLCVKGGRRKSGSILGIVTNSLGWIPILGWALHVATAIVLLVEYISESKYGHGIEKLGYE